ncbi:glycosyltransferase family 4 protein [Paraburkholderia aspalathi]|uniref:Glycosyltransferase involved in cell wall bisynthesis n=1 Tax=Paraburkholderia aspalathi TaxID=1324617 RepID=A0A1I7ELN4_9BURK|nr:glycosyltransferase family 4 protein [Paraburkholderia aspalathi]SFU24817.1 Glycosyltransferase involved in cell wall bisynthesis [Paraburkholderia aspalathi]
MKIFYLNQLYSPHVAGGSEICLQEEAQGMLARGHEVTVLATGPTPGIAIDHVNGVKVIRAGTNNVYWHYKKEQRSFVQGKTWHIKDSYNASMAAIVETVLDTEAPDLVAVHTLPGWSAAAWQAIANKNIPIVQVLHDLYHLCPTTQMFKGGEVCEQRCVSCRLLRVRSRSASSVVSAVVGVSRFVLDKHLSAGFFSNASIRKVVFNARSLTGEDVISTSEACTSSDVRFGFIGTLSQAKGLEFLLNEFSGKLPGATLSIAGRGDPAYVDPLKKKYESESIRFLGYVKPSDFFASIDVLVVPSLWNDTYPGVVVESHIYGVPVIGSARGGIPEIITEKVTGLIFEPTEDGALLKAMKHFVDATEQIKKMGAAAKESSRAMVDIKSWLDTYENIYMNLLEATVG